MAWALSRDGVNDYLLMSSPVPLTGDFSVEIDCDITLATSEGFLELSTSTNNFFGKLNNNSFYCRLGGVTSVVSHSFTTGRHQMKWVRVGSTLSFYVDSILLQTFTNTGTSDIDLIGRLQGGSYPSGNLYGLEITDSNGVQYSWSPDASDHSNTGSQPVLVDTAGSNNATGVNMPTDGSAWKAIFPDAYTLLVEYDLPTITGTHTDFVMLLKYDDFNVGDALNFWDNGGGDLRISDDINGTTQLPIEVVEFDKVGLSAQVWVKIPSAFTGKTIYLWGNNTGDSQPAVTDAYGRNAVYSKLLRGYLGSDLKVDVSGNFTDGTFEKGLEVTGTDSLGSYTEFDGDDAVKIPDIGTLTTATITALIQNDADSSLGYVIAHSDWSGGSRLYLGYAADETVFARIGSSSGTTTSTGGTGVRHAALSLSGGQRTLYDNGDVAAAAASYSGNAGSNVETTAIGCYLQDNGASNSYFDGRIYSLFIHNRALSQDYIATEYDNQSTVGAWGTPTRVGGGGATYTINIDSLASTGSFTDLSLLHNKKLNLDAISATANFDNVDLHYNRKLQLNALAATGQFETVTLRHNRKLNLDTLTASGQFEAVTLDYNQGYSLTLGTLAATGGFDDVNLRHNRKLNLDTLSATGQFQAVTLNYTPSSVTYTLALDTLAATTSFDDVALRHNRKLNIEPIVATAYFDDVALLKGHKLNLNSLSSTATFNDVELLHNRVLSLEPITADANFQAIALNWSGFVEQRITNFSMRYKDNPVKASYKAQPFTIKFKE